MLGDAAAPAGLHPEIGRFVMIWLGIAVVGAGVVLFLRWRVPAARGRLFPPQRHRAVPWGFGEIVMVVAASYFWVGLALVLFGLDKPEQFPKPVREERVLWAQVLAAPLQILSVVLLLQKHADARLYQLGITTHRLPKDLILAWLFWFALTPFVFGVHWFAIYLTQLLDTPVKDNPLTELLKADLQWSTLAVVLVAVLGAAPVIEELLVRGVIQPWMVDRPAVPDLIMLLVLIGTIVFGALVKSWWPLLFLVTVGPGYLLFEFLTRGWLPRPGAARAIYVSSLLFAVMHPWPNQISLFVLSLGLGFLAYRTQSLVGPIVLHVLFNLIGAIQLVIQKVGWLPPLQ